MTPTPAPARLLSRRDVVSRLWRDPTALAEVGLRALLHRAAVGLEADRILWVGPPGSADDQAPESWRPVALTAETLRGAPYDLREAAFGGAVWLAEPHATDQAATAPCLAAALRPDGWLVAALPTGGPGNGPPIRVGDLRRAARRLLEGAGFVNLSMAGTTGTWATAAAGAVERLHVGLGGATRTLSGLADRALALSAIAAWHLDKYFGHQGRPLHLVVLARRARAAA